MIIKSALSALLSTGIVIPEKPTFILPKPAIIKAESIEFSKHIMLGDRKSSAISYVNSITSGYPGTSVSIPTHQVGDLILIVAWNGLSTTIPTIPAAGFTTIRTQSGNAWALVLAFQIATTTTTTSGTWTNATSVTVGVYRGATGVGASISRTPGSSTSCVWDSLNLTNNNWNISWVVGLAATRTTVSGNPVAPTGRTERINTGYNRWWDTNGPITGNYTSQSSTMTSQTYASAVVEIVSK
jgi:hypothetical protein